MEIDNENVNINVSSFEKMEVENENFNENQIFNNVESSDKVLNKEINNTLCNSEKKKLKLIV